MQCNGSMEVWVYVRMSVCMLDIVFLLLNIHMFYLCILLPSLTSFESLSDVVGHVEMLYIVNFDQTFGTRRPSTVNSLPALEMFMPSAFGSSACLKV